MVETSYWGGYNLSNIKDKKLKIAMIGHKRIPSREDSIEIVVNELSKRIVEYGHKVTVYNGKRIM